MTLQTQRATSYLVPSSPQSKNPRFSILLPTKNRPDIIKNAVLSVLQQDFLDWELIISVNDDDDTETKASLSNLLDDIRIKYIRTPGNLSMSDNWENALNHSSGDYITVLEDKMVLYPKALSKIQGALGFWSGVDILLWRIDTFQDQGTLLKYWGGHKVTVLEPWRILSDFVTEGYKFGSGLRRNANVYLPRMINCCASRSLINTILEDPRSPKFFPPVNPDFTSGFLLLHHTAKFVYSLDLSLSVWGPSARSNSYLIRHKLPGHERFFEDVTRSHGKIETPEGLMPSNYLAGPLVYSDYIRLRDKLRGRFLPYQMSKKDYALMYLLDTIRMYGARTLISQELKDWSKLLSNMNLIELINLGWSIGTTGIDLAIRGYLYTKRKEGTGKVGSWSTLKGYPDTLEITQKLSW